MPRSRRRHHSRSRSRSRSDSHDKDREPKRRKIESYDSPHHRKSVSSESESNEKINSPQILEENEIESSPNDEIVTIDERNKSELGDGSKKVQDDNVMETKTSENVISKADETATANLEFQKPQEETSEKLVPKSVPISLNKTPQKALTPKQLQKKLESEKKRLEKQKERDEKLKKVQEMREEKKKALEQQRLEKEMKKQKEEEEKLLKRKEKEDEKLQKQREKEEKILKRKEEEEERKRKREQERIKRQQEIDDKNREKQKLEEQKQKAAAAFVNFFVAKKNGDLKSSEVNESCNFMPFEVKSDMRLAPFSRKIMKEEEKEELGRLMEKQELKLLYLNELRAGKEIGKGGKTWPYDDDSDDVMIVDDLGESILQCNSVKMRAKLLKFHENQRPPYFGTWRKRSKTIKPRNPFKTDEIFNYEIDSDEEWEDEVDGESIAGSDDEEKENESENDYEVDNEFFVPHGHLSEDEGGSDEEEKALDPEAHKTKLKLMKNQFDEERKSKTLKIKPRVFGCIWYNKDEPVDEAMDRHFKPLSVICNNTIIIKKRSDLIFASRKIEKPGFEKELIPEFLKFLHGNVQRNRRILTNEYLKILGSKNIIPTVTKIGIFRQIKLLAHWKRCPDEGALFKKYCWYVDQDTRIEYGVDLKIPEQ